MTEFRKACVIGDPISHSLSPRLHGYWLKEYGINGSYEAVQLRRDGLSSWLSAMQEAGYVGCNITLPHKEAALSCMDEITDAAKKIGAVNTVSLSPEGKRIGDNTDAYGFMAALKSCWPDLSHYKHKALILGAGGAARAIAVALKQEGFHLAITNRTESAMQQLANEIGIKEMIDWQKKEQVLGEVTLLVNATSLGMRGASPLDLSLTHLPQTSIVYDIVYNPLQTELLRAAHTRGNKTVTGIGMLLHQAVPGFEAWFGKRPEVSAQQEAYVLEGIA